MVSTSLMPAVKLPLRPLTSKEVLLLTKLSICASSSAVIDAGAVQGAPEQFVKDDHPVPAVEQKQGEYLMLVIAQQRLQVAEYFVR